jgi:hypothetical protein
VEKLQNLEELVSRLKPGTCLWRDFAVHTTEGICVAEVPFVRTDKGNYMVRLEFISNWLFEATVWNRIQKPIGIIVFVDEIPPAGWTHLVVKRVAHNCKSITAVYAGSLPLEDYRRFCWDSYRLRSETLNAAVEEKIAAGLSIKVETPVDQHRMIVGTYWNDRELSPAYQYLESK